MLKKIGINLYKSLVILIIVPVIITAQTLRWSFISDGPAHQDDEVYKVIRASDGYVYAVGYQTTSYGKDITVMKFSRWGVQQWAYRTLWPGDDVGCDIIYAGGNLYVAGYATGQGKEFVVLSLNTSGNYRWSWISDGPDHADDEAFSICYGGSYVYAAGYQTNGGDKDITVFKLSTSGVSQWAYRSYWSYDDEGYDIIYGSDGNLYIAGYAGGGGTNLKDFVALSLDASGGERWSWISDGSANQDDEAFSVVYSSGYVYAAGYKTFSSKHIEIDCLSASGTPQWAYRTYWSYDDVGFDIVYGSDGNLYVAGYANGGGTNMKDFAVLSVNTSGSERWSWISDGSAHQDDEARAICYAGNYVCAVGYKTMSGSGKDIEVDCLNTSGTPQWAYRTLWSGNDIGYSIAYDGWLYVGGYCTGQGREFTVLSLDPPVAITEDNDMNQKMSYLIKGYPNPMQNSITFAITAKTPGIFNLKIYDQSGKLVKALTNDEFLTDSHEILWDGKDDNGKNCSAGVYFCKIETQNLSKVMKIVKLE